MERPTARDPFLDGPTVAECVAAVLDYQFAFAGDPEPSDCPRLAEVLQAFPESSWPMLAWVAAVTREEFESWQGRSSGACETRQEHQGSAPGKAPSQP